MQQFYFMRINENIIPEVKVLEENNSTSMKMKKNTFFVNSFLFCFQLYIGFSTHLSSPNTVPIGHVICWNLQLKVSENVYTLSQVKLLY